MKSLPQGFHDQSDVGLAESLPAVIIEECISRPEKGIVHSLPFEAGKTFPSRVHPVLSLSSAIQAAAQGGSGTYHCHPPM